MLERAVFFGRVLKYLGIYNPALLENKNHLSGLRVERQVFIKRNYLILNLTIQHSMLFSRTLSSQRKRPMSNQSCPPGKLWCLFNVIRIGSFAVVALYKNILVYKTLS